MQHGCRQQTKAGPPTGGHTLYVLSFNHALQLEFNQDPTNCSWGAIQAFPSSLSERARLLLTLFLYWQVW
eukprot:1144124-Pelagomonas_calceolata.AAC.2